MTQRFPGQHAEIRRETDRFAIVDLKSSNGTFVNSKAVESHSLNNGDRLQVGRTLMIFTGPDSASTHDVNDVINIVGANQPDDDSHIVHSMTQEESEFLLGELKQAQSPWLARAPQQPANHVSDGAGRQPHARYRTTAQTASWN